MRWRFSLSILSCRITNKWAAQREPPVGNYRDARKLLAADSGTAHFAQAGFCLMRVALFFAR
jgi:hypothetical protein